MKSIMRLMLLVILALGVALPIAAQDKQPEAIQKLSLSDCVKLALANNRQILQGKEMLNGTDAKIDEYKSYLYPHLQIDANYARLGKVPEYMGFKMASANNYSYKATVSQLLYAWGKVDKGIALSQAEVEMVKGTVSLTEQEISFAVIGFFYHLLTVQESIKVIDENVSLLEQQLDMLRKKFEQGEVSDFDILSIEVQVSMLKGQRLDTVNNLRKMKLQFNLVIGRAVETEVELEGFLDHEMITPDEKNALNEALANRIEIRQIMNKTEIAQLQKDLAAASNKPNLNAFANWELKNGYQPNMNDLQGAWTFGAMISFPLFDGWRTDAQVRQAGANINAIKIEYEQKKQEISVEVRQAVLDIESSWQKIKIGELTIDRAEKAYKIAEERFKNGLASTLDLLNAQSNMTNARLNLLQSVYNYSLSKYSLDKAVGKQILAN